MNEVIIHRDSDKPPSFCYNSSMKTISKTRAFTLIELMVVVAIIAILTAIILPALAGSKAKARDAQRVSDLGQLQLALELYYDRCGQYPATLSFDPNTTGNGCPEATPKINLGTYIAQIPTPPAGTNQTNYGYTVMSASGGPAVNYVLHTLLESTNAAVAKGLGSMPTLPNGYSWSAGSYSCDNGPGSTDYCIGPN